MVLYSSTAITEQNQGCPPKLRVAFAILRFPRDNQEEFYYT